MSKRKRQKSQLNFGIPKERPGRIAKPFKTNTRTPGQISRAKALRNASMRLLAPMEYRENVLNKIHSIKPILKSKPIVKNDWHLNKRRYTVQGQLIQKTHCQKKAERRAVLLAKGKVQKAGGAPGPYKPRSKVKCK